MKIRALIVDDEPLARRRSRALLRGESDVEVVGECGDVPNLSVRMFLNVARGDDDRDSNEGIVRSFYLSFKSKDWPWEKYPKVFYDLRALETAFSKRASLHAKCIVVDRMKCFVSSANFTRAGFCSAPPASGSAVLPDA